MLIHPQPSSHAVVYDRASFLRAVRARKRRRTKLKRPMLRAPKGIERQYATELLRILAQLGPLVRTRLLPQLPELTRAKRADSTRMDARTIRVAVDELEINFAAEFDIAARARARQAAQNVDASSQQQTRALTQSVLGVRMEAAEPWLTDELSDFVSRQARLVKRVSTDFFDRLEQRIESGVRTGQTIDAISREIARDFIATGGEEVAKVQRRARLIARDQVGSYFGDLTQRRQSALGIDRYTWSTSHDERVRTSHDERDGQIFEWGRSIEDQLEERGFTVDKIEGHPGRPISCRCVALPYLADLLAP